MQDNREKFIRLAESRTLKTIKDLRLIGNLSNRNSYSYGAEDIDKIFGAIEAAVKSARTKFEDRKEAKEPTFSLS